MATHLVTGRSYTYDVIQIHQDQYLDSTCAAYLYIFIGVNYEAKENLDLSITSIPILPPPIDQSEPRKFDMMPPDRTVGAWILEQARMDRGGGTYPTVLYRYRSTNLISL